MELFLIQYEYLTITSNSVTLSNVPTQSYVESTNDGGTTSSKINKKAVASEIKRRYATEIPHVHVHEHAHIHKKKWTGLQGEFITEQKRSDLGKDRLKKI
jgi:hypothetical protein